MLIKINTTYAIGDIVFLVTDYEQLKRIITGINLRPGNQVIYQVTCGTEESYHYDIELSLEKDVVMATSG